MSANQATIDFIRQVMADGIVSEDEVISLGTYLNENRDARKSWPGSAIFEVLKDILADGKIEDYETVGLSKILQGIERICAGDTMGDTGVTQVAVAKKSDTTDCTVPTLDQKITISAANQFDSGKMVDLKRYECECNDWLIKRTTLPIGCPGRMCKHLVKGFELACSGNPDIKKSCDKLFLALINSSSDTNRGLDGVANWKLLSKDDVHFLAAWGPKSEWCNIYTENASGNLERFGYQIKKKRWSFGARPKKAGILKKFLKENF